eukprot:scaffold76744_cov67-Phaeocystis_antarctica.AAC.13
MLIVPREHPASRLAQRRDQAHVWSQVMRHPAAQEKRRAHVGEEERVAIVVAEDGAVLVRRIPSREDACVPADNHGSILKVGCHPVCCEHVLLLALPRGTGPCEEEAWPVGAQGPDRFNCAISGVDALPQERGVCDPWVCTHRQWAIQRARSRCERHQERQHPRRKTQSFFFFAKSGRSARYFPMGLLVRYLSWACIGGQQCRFARPNAEGEWSKSSGFN